MKPNPYISRVCHSLILRLAVLMVVLAWSRLAFCGEIHDAAAKGDLEKVKALLKANPDLVFSKGTNDWGLWDGGTPLHFAVVSGRTNVIELLLVNKADVNAKDNMGRTPLHWVRDKDAAKMLLTNNAEVNAKDINGEEPLHFAATGGFKDVAELLIANKAEIDTKSIFGETPLYRAAQDGQKGVAELLIANKADVNAKANNGWTPLHVAVFYTQTDVADLLRQHGGHE
jgi:ankyrin repeat protein